MHICLELSRKGPGATWKRPYPLMRRVETWVMSHVSRSHITHIYTIVMLPPQKTCSHQNSPCPLPTRVQTWSICAFPLPIPNRKTLLAAFLSSFFWAAVTWRCWAPPSSCVCVYERVRLCVSVCVSVCACVSRYECIYTRTHTGNHGRTHRFVWRKRLGWKRERDESDSVMKERVGWQKEWEEVAVEGLHVSMKKRGRWRWEWDERERVMKWPEKDCKYEDCMNEWKRDWDERESVMKERMKWKREWDEKESEIKERVRWNGSRKTACMNERESEMKERVWWKRECEEVALEKFHVFMKVWVRWKGKWDE